MEKRTFPDLFQGLFQSCRKLFEDPFLRGKRMAQADINAGSLVLKTYGQPVKWRPIYAELLKNEYGVVLESVSDQTVGSRKREEIRGYNSVTKEVIRKKHGSKVLELVVEKAQEISLKADKNR